MKWFSGNNLSSENPRLTWSEAARKTPLPTVTRLRPKICQLLHSLCVGGAEVLAARLARQLRDRCRFLFVCLDEIGTLGEELRDEGFPVHLIGRRPGLDWRCSYRLARLLRQNKVDIVHAHQYTPFFYGMTARFLYRRPGVIFTEHGRHFPDYPRRKRMLVNRLLLTRRDRVVGVGEAVRKALIENEGISNDRVTVIYNGIALSPFTEKGCDREKVRQEIGIGSDELLILQVARLDYLKDHATAIRTLGHVVGQRPNARLVLVGEGPERAKIEELSRQAGLENHVQLLGLRKDVSRLLYAADVFLLTSISEGIPLTLIEAMAAGLPVVATRVGGVGEVIEDGTTGLLAPSSDDSALAERILQLAGDRERRMRMGETGRQRATAIFSENRMHGEYLRLYEEMLRG
jgi:sugar transferase (PEP-CTERM/EpsH1 system associated)